MTLSISLHEKVTYQIERVNTFSRSEKNIKSDRKRICKTIKSSCNISTEKPINSDVSLCYLNIIHKILTRLYFVDSIQEINVSVKTY